MKIRPGPRPWSIHLFAAAFAGVALIGLLIALSSEPLLELFKWSKRLPMVPWNRDAVIIASFSVFTMALFPLVWIYGFGSARARWIVLGFAGVKIALWAQGMVVVTLTGWIQAARWLEPSLTVLAVAMMLAPASSRWLKQEKEADIAQFS